MPLKVILFLHMANCKIGKSFHFPMTNVTELKNAFLPHCDYPILVPRNYPRTYFVLFRSRNLKWCKQANRNCSSAHLGEGG